MIGSGAVRTEYKGYTIEVIARQKDGLWTVDVWLWTSEQRGAPLKKAWRDDGYSSENDAMAAGVALAEAEVDMGLSR